MRLLRLYPRAWRARYGEEMLVLLEQHHLSIRTRINLLRGALDAQLHMRSPTMSGNRRPSVRWSLLVALLPSTLVVVHWVCQLYPFSGDSTLWNALVILGMMVAALAATWAGTRAQGMGGRLRDSAVAGGLVGTANDYAAFAQMLLNGGEFRGARIVSTEGLGLMMANHLSPALIAGGFGVGKQVIRPGYGYGYDGALFTDPALAGVPVGEGTYQWDGAAGTWFWVDPANDLLFVGLIQRMDPESTPLQLITQRLIAQALL